MTTGTCLGAGRRRDRGPLTDYESGVAAKHYDFFRHLISNDFRGYTRVFGLDDVRSFLTLHYLSVVRSWCRRRTVEEVEAADGLLAYLRTTLRWKLKTYYRDTFRRDAAVDPVDPDKVPVSADPVAEEAAEEAFDVLDDALADVPPLQRETLRAYYGLGGRVSESQSEIARRRGVAIEVVHKSAKRGLRNLERLLREKGVTTWPLR